MRLRHTAEYTATIGYLIVAALALIALALSMAQLPPDRYLFQAHYLVLLAALFVVLGPPFATIYWEQRLRRITPTGAPDMAVARHQPDAALSLAPGETVWLRSLPLRWQEKWQLGLFMSFLFPAMLDGLVLYFEPNVIRQVESLIYGAFHALRLVGPGQLVAPSAAPVSTAQWALADAPLLIGALFLISALLSRSATFHETLTADDRGLIWRASLWRTRFIAWGDIQRFVARVSVPSYCVFGSRETISFHAPQTKGAEIPIAPPEETITPPSQVRNRARLAKEAHDAQALRLVATIVARGGKPLLLVGGPNYATEDVAAAPLADERTLRQTMATLDDEFPLDETLLLQTRLSTQAFLRSSLRWALTIPAAFLLLLLIISPADLLMPSSLTYIVGGSVALWLMGVFIVPLMRTQAYRNAHPAVEVSVKGLALRGYNDKVMARANWADLRAWAVERSALNSASAGRPADMSIGMQYIVVTDNGKLLTWDEPADGELNDAQLATPEARRAAYREYAATLHALIAARSGLPLRELPNE